MARKNVISITTNVTPEQYEVITLLKDTFAVNEAHFIRMALAQFVERNNGKWPTGDIKHGGKHLPPNNEGVQN